MSCKALIVSFLTFLFASQLSFALSTIALRDSIGAERKGNGWLVLHKVAPGETLSAIARKYQTTVKAIQVENPHIAAGLKSGAVVKVPYTAVDKPATSTAAATSPSPASGQTTHTVKAGQGLFSIAKMYQVSVADLRQWNNLSSDNIRPGQELVISGDEAQAQPVAAVTSSDNTALEEKSLPKTVEKAKKHKVRKGETLTTIAKKYKVSTATLKEWNHLRSASVRTGQVLTVSKPVKAGAPSAESTEGNTDAAENENMALVKPDKHPPKTNDHSSATNPEEVLTDENTVAPPVGEGAKPNTTASAGSYTIPNTSGYTETVENGLAEVINDTDESDLFLALHRTAPVGTLLKVRNQMNNQIVFVKVVGKLPDTGANDKLVVKVSRKAYERLAAVDRRFRVEVAYMPINN